MARTLGLRKPAFLNIQGLGKTFLVTLSFAKVDPELGLISKKANSSNNLNFIFTWILPFYVPISFLKNSAFVELLRAEKKIRGDFVLR